MKPDSMASSSSGGSSRQAHPSCIILLVAFCQLFMEGRTRWRTMDELSELKEGASEQLLEGLCLAEGWRINLQGGPPGTDEDDESA